MVQKKPQGHYCKVRQHFPFAERNALKKQLRLNEVEFNVNASLWDEDGYEHLACRIFQ